MEFLYRLIYTSSRRPSCTDVEIENILKACERNNPKRGITGILLHSNKRFLQYLEGSRLELFDLYDKIKLDPRHGGVNIRDFSPIEKRLFPSWHMGYKDINSQSVEFLSKISEKDRAIFKELIQEREYEIDDAINVMKTFFEIS